MFLHVVSPLFTGKQPPEGEMGRRIAAWNDFFNSADFEDLKIACGDRVSITPYHPGKEIYIPSKKHPDPIKIIYPSNWEATIPKGFVTRLHLLFLLYQLEHSEENISDIVSPADIIFACIDGSGAFEFSSLTLLVNTFKENASADVVLGRRPLDHSGMIQGRKEIEEFEQYLLFRHRAHQLKTAFADYDLSDDRLPDGQAGCWGFRLCCAPYLPLTANGYEIEFDLLASAVEAQLRIAYTSPLPMPRAVRHSSAPMGAIEMSIGKLEFIRRKLKITQKDVARGWRDFTSRFAGTPVMDKILKGYEEELLRTYTVD